MSEPKQIGRRPERLMLTRALFLEIRFAAERLSTVEWFRLLDKHWAEIREAAALGLRANERTLIQAKTHAYQIERHRTKIAHLEKLLRASGINYPKTEVQWDELFGVSSVGAQPSEEKMDESEDTEPNNPVPTEDNPEEELPPLEFP